MKIAFIDLLFNWPPDGGARTDIKEIASRAGQEHDVCMFVPQFDYGFPRGGIRSPLDIPIEKIAFDESTFNYRDVPVLFRQAMKRYKPDLVFVGDGWFLKAYLVAALQDFRVIKRFYAYEGLCIRGHGFFFKDGAFCNECFYGADQRGSYHCFRCARQWLKEEKDVKFIQEFSEAVFCPLVYQKVLQRSLKSSSAIIVYNDFIGQLLAQFSDKVHVIPSGVDTKLFDPGAYPSANKTDGKTHLLMVGRSEDVLKGYDVLKRAAALLHRDRDDFRVTVTSGKGQTGRQDGIDFVGWCLHEKLPALYASADICVVPSVWEEPFGIVALEAMAMQKPVIVSDVGGLRTTVQHQVSGFVTPPGDPAALARHIAYLLDYPEERKCMGQEARKRAVQQFQWDTIYETYYKDIFR